ncbi:hypothetical protein WS68_01125 [Burkholderia sp. TSV86]|nr:hypothetical protein WS68_01125 [Burkholderia sp. TSV86]
MKPSRQRLVVSGASEQACFARTPVMYAALGGASAATSIFPGIFSIIGAKSAPCAAGKRPALACRLPAHRPHSRF